MITSTKYRELPCKCAILGLGSSRRRRRAPWRHWLGMKLGLPAFRTLTEIHRLSYRKLGYSETYVNPCCAEIGSGVFDLDSFDDVYTAALVGVIDEEKEKVVAATMKHMRPEALLILGSAHHLRSLMYPGTIRFFVLWCFHLGVR